MPIVPSIPQGSSSPSPKPPSGPGAAPGSPSASSVGKPADLEVKDAQLIFKSVWDDLEAKIGKENLRFPREIILLGGAPGAGKGTNTPFILKVRSLTCEPIVVSSLLTTPEAQRIKNAGGIVGDREVVSIILRKLLEPQYMNGAIIDGFPRTKVQVECLKLLYDKLHQLRREFYNTPLGVHFPQPIYHIMVLFVDEKESIVRQLKRGREIRAHNEEVRRTGMGMLMEERVTDLSEEAARNRYRVFKEQTYDALVSLKEVFYYHFINAQCSLEEVQQNIISELTYQSSLELDPRTFDRLRSLPLSSEIVRHARQELVRRLDSYEIEHSELFDRVIKFIDHKMMPIVKRHAISGIAMVNSEDPIFQESLALAMLIDIFSERGYHAVVDIQKLEVPRKFDLKTGEIECRTKKVYRMQIRFAGSIIRRGTRAI
jgi:adenylate kinase